MHPTVIIATMCQIDTACHAMRISNHECHVYLHLRCHKQKTVCLFYIYFSLLLLCIEAQSSDSVSAV